MCVKNFKICNCTFKIVATIEILQMLENWFQRNIYARGLNCFKFEYIKLDLKSILIQNYWLILDLKKSILSRSTEIIHSEKVYSIFCETYYIDHYFIKYRSLKLQQNYLNDSHLLVFNFFKNILAHRLETSQNTQKSSTTKNFQSFSP